MLDLIYSVRTCDLETFIISEMSSVESQTLLTTEKIPSPVYGVKLDSINITLGELSDMYANKVKR